MTDLSHLPPSGEDEIRARLRDAGIELPDELFRQFAAVWPEFEAIIVFTPMTAPRESSSGPPELPGLIAASV